MAVATALETAPEGHHHHHHLCRQPRLSFRGPVESYRNATASEEAKAGWLQDQVVRFGTYTSDTSP